MQLDERVGHCWQERSISRRAELAKTEAPIERIAKRFHRKAMAIEKQFCALHGQSSIEHLADVIRHTSKIISNCDCFACLKAKYVQPKPRRLEQYTRNEN